MKYWNFFIYKGERITFKEANKLPLEEQEKVTFETVEVTDEEYKILVNL